MKDETKPQCCDKDMNKVISGGGFILKGDGWAGQDWTRTREDGYISSVSYRARELKKSGKVKMEDHLSFKDVEKLNPE